MTPERVDVAVVGAGLSGLTAAFRLRRAGCSVLVAEAGARAGGRVWTRTDRGLRWDAGGEAVDRANTALRALAADAGAALVPSDVGWGDHAPAPPLIEVAGRRVDAPPPASRALAEELRRLGAEPGPPADALTVAGWLAARGATPFERAYVAAEVSVTASTVPLDRMSLVALARKQAARAGHGAGSELRLAGGAGGFAVRLAAALGGGTVRMRTRAVAVERRRDGLAIRLAAGPPVRARRAVVAVPLPARRRIAGLPHVPPGTYGVAAKSLLRLAAEPPADAPLSALTDTPLGFAYRHGPRSLVSFVGGRPAARLLALGAAADREVAAAARRAFGVGPATIVRVPWRRSYLILAPGELAGWAADLAEPAGAVHFAGAETSELPSFMEGAVRAGERAAAEALAQL